LQKKQILDLIYDEPYKLAHWLGFKDFTQLHNTWLKEMVFSVEDETILGHRGSYKTTTLSLAISLLMILKPNKSIMFLRKTDTDVIEVIKQVSNIIRSPVFLRIVKELYGVDLNLVTDTSFKVDTNLKTSAKGTVQLLGMGTSGSLTGKHADYIFTDDIVNTKDRVSRAERERIKLVYMELENVKNRDGRIFNTGTPWHKEDAIGIMPNVKKYDCYTTGLIDKKKLQDIRSKMTPSLFAANYELKHIANEDALFTNPKFFNDKKLLFNSVAHIDASYGGSDGTAYTIIKQQGNAFYVLGKRYDKHIDKCLSDIYMLHDRYRAGTIYCERNADKGYLEKEMRKDGMIVQGYQESTNKYVKIATYLLKNWDNVYFHEDTDPDYLNEILDYTENAEHDDSPDSLASILRELTGKGNWIL
jgi:phage terminase large subunit-like protein